ncbi:MAG: hypothetical protein ACRDLP_17870 [Solirubrobacteraceae bacterium]
MGLTITVYHLAAGEYCLQFSPSIPYYSPIIATLHDGYVGFISVNDESGNTCNPSGGVEVMTEKSVGTATDEWFAVGLL